MSLENHAVAVVHHPSVTSYPAFPYGPEASEVYTSVRQALLDLGLDAENPFGSFIKPGQSVLLKPNWVRDFNPVDQNIDSLVTHSAVLRPVIDFVALALKGKGRITLADAPLQSCDFDALMEKTRAAELVNHLRGQHPGIEFSLVDLRKTVLKRLTAAEKLQGKEFQLENEGDPNGYSLVSLGDQSLLTDLDHLSDRFRVTNYDHRLLKEHHGNGTHEYLVANAILNADVVINLPKMKTHIKAGITGALKNLIGINGHKEFLPHHVNGSFFEGGDQYMYTSWVKRLHNVIYDRYWAEHRTQSSLQNRIQTTTMLGLAALSKIFDKENLYDGGWHGNETIPRTTLDLNHVLYFYDPKTRQLADTPVRTVFHLIDGIVAGEKNGPLRPLAKPAGVIIAGFNPLLVDLTMAQLVGYHPLKVKTVFYGLYHKKSRLIGHLPSVSGFSVSYNGKPTRLDALPNLRFWIPKHWRAIAHA